MKPISSKIVEKTWKRIGGMSPAEMPKLVSLMNRKQPFIIAYLMGVGGDTLNQDERELLVYLGVVVWQIMSQGSVSLPKITGEALDKAERVNMKMLEYLEAELEPGFTQVVKTILNSYNQIEVLRYVVEALMEESEEEACLIRDESKGLLLLYLKTVIDCLDKY